MKIWNCIAYPKWVTHKNMQKSFLGLVLFWRGKEVDNVKKLYTFIFFVKKIFIEHLTSARYTVFPQNWDLARPSALVSLLEQKLI